MAAEYATHYATIEKELRSLFQKENHWLSPRHRAEVTELLAAREYGLALEEISESLRARGHVDAFVPWIIKLAREMEIENQPFVKALARWSRRGAIISGS